jgi:16S rRNA (guanine527-N7)-methyltransferase
MCTGPGAAGCFTFYIGRLVRAAIGPLSSVMRAEGTLAAYVERWGLPAGADGQLGELARLIAAEEGAPTTVREPQRILEDHLADSLVALELDHVAWDGRIADLGAGAGFPGLPLAIAQPVASVALVESNARKCEFLRSTVRQLGVDNVEIVRERAEQWNEGLDGCDVVVARALAALPVVAEYAAPLLRIGGTMVAWRGRRDPVDETMGAIAAAELGLEPLDPVAVSPYPEALHRHLHVMVKVRPTPSRFPRRPGVARKHPLGRAV